MAMSFGKRGGSRLRGRIAERHRENPEGEEKTKKGGFLGSHLRNEATPYVDKKGLSDFEGNCEFGPFDPILACFQAKNAPFGH